MRVVLFLFTILGLTNKSFAQRLPLNEEIRIKNGALDLYVEYSTLRNLEDFSEIEYFFDSEAQIVNECIIHKDYLKPIGLQDFRNAFDIETFLNPPNHDETFFMNSLPYFISNPEYITTRDKEDIDKNIVKGSLEISFYKVLTNRYSFYYGAEIDDKDKNIVLFGKAFDRKRGRKLEELRLPELVDTIWLKMIVNFELKSTTFDSKIKFGRLRDDYRINRIEYVKNSNGPSDVLLVDRSLQQDEDLNLGYNISLVNTVLDSSLHMFNYYPKVKLLKDYPYFYKQDIEFGKIKAIINDSLIYDGGNQKIKFPHLLYYYPGEIKKWKAGIEFGSSFGNVMEFLGNSFTSSFQSLDVVLKRRLEKSFLSNKGFFEYHIGLNFTNIDLGISGLKNNSLIPHFDSEGDSYIRKVVFTDIQYKTRTQMVGLNTGFSYWKAFSKKETPWLFGVRLKIGYHQTYQPVIFSSTSELLISGYYPQYFNITFNTSGIEDFGQKKNNFDFTLTNVVHMQNSSLLLSFRKMLRFKRSIWSLGFSGGLSQSYFYYSGNLPNLEILNSSNLYPGSFNLSKNLILQGVYNISLIKVIQ